MTLLWCRHTRTTWPQTRRGDRQAYIVCLDCCAEFEYTIGFGRGPRILRNEEQHAAKTEFLESDAPIVQPEG